MNWGSASFWLLANDAGFKAAQLVRSCRALKEMSLAYGVPLLSGKDSMYVDGHLPGAYGETHKVSALESLQFSTIGVIEDVEKCVTMDVKIPGDLVYVLGVTRNELGASEYYEHLGYVGTQVPQVYPDRFIPLYNALHGAIQEGLTASVHGVYRGGLGVHLALAAMGGELGMTVNLGRVVAEGVDRADTLLFSESPGRFIVTVNPDDQETFETFFKDLPIACVGSVTDGPDLIIQNADGLCIVQVPIHELKTAWKKPFGGLI